MGRKTLKVIGDFYDKEVKAGDVVNFFAGKVKVLDMNYQNQFGSFILCEYLDIDELDDDPPTARNMGKSASQDCPFEVVGSIHIPGYRNLLGGIGFFVKNRNDGEIMGLSFRETWKLLFQEGAVNAEASESRSDMFFGKLIDSIDGLPSLDSVYWKIAAYDQTGKPFAKFSREAEAEIKKGIKYAVQNRIRDLNHYRKIDLMELSELDTVAELIQKVERIVVLAGAGLSTSSGIPDYRSAAEGLWKKDPSLLKDLDQTTFEYDPERFWGIFYKLIETSLSAVVPFPTESALLATIEAIAPNNGHQFFAWLEKELGKSVTVITQNVDNLEKQAGITNVIQMHGNIHEVICPVCQKTYPLKRVLKKEHVPRCKCHAVLRPNVVFFGDRVNGFDEAQRIVESADLILIVGTSLEVYPFNELPFLKSGAKTVLLNGTRSDSYLIDYTLQGEISTICWKLREKIQGEYR